MAQVQDIEFAQGDDVEITVTLPGAGNIGAYALSASIRRVGSRVPLLTVTTGAGITITDAANSVYQIVLTSAQTGALAPGHYRWESRRTNAGGNAQLVRGRCTIEESSQT